MVDLECAIYKCDYNLELNNSELKVVTYTIFVTLICEMEPENHQLFGQENYWGRLEMKVK